MENVQREEHKKLLCIHHLDARIIYSKPIIFHAHPYPLPPALPPWIILKQTPHITQFQQEIQPGGMAPAEECLPSKHKALNSNPSLSPKKPL
jgi:hypothetical protein